VGKNGKLRSLLLRKNQQFSLTADFHFWLHTTIAGFFGQLFWHVLKKKKKKITSKKKGKEKRKSVELF